MIMYSLMVNLELFEEVDNHSFLEVSGQLVSAKWWSSQIFLHVRTHASMFFSELALSRSKKRCHAGIHSFATAAKHVGLILSPTLCP